MTHYCSVEWLATYNNLDECVQMVHSDDRSVASLVKNSCCKATIILLGLFLNNLGGTPKIDIPLSFLLSLALSVLGSLSSKLSLLARRIKMTLL